LQAFATNTKIVPQIPAYKGFVLQPPPWLCDMAGRYGFFSVIAWMTKRIPQERAKFPHGPAAHFGRQGRFALAALAQGHCATHTVRSKPFKRSIP